MSAGAMLDPPDFATLARGNCGGDLAAAAATAVDSANSRRPRPAASAADAAEERAALLQQIIVDESGMVTARGRDAGRCPAPQRVGATGVDGTASPWAVQARYRGRTRHGRPPVRSAIFSNFLMPLRHLRRWPVRSAIFSNFLTPLAICAEGGAQMAECHKEVAENSTSDGAPRVGARAGAHAWVGGCDFVPAKTRFQCVFVRFHAGMPLPPPHFPLAVSLLSNALIAPRRVRPSPPADPASG